MRIFPILLLLGSIGLCSCVSLPKEYAPLSKSMIGRVEKAANSNIAKKFFKFAKALGSLTSAGKFALMVYEVLLGSTEEEEEAEMGKQRIIFF